MKRTERPFTAAPAEQARGRLVPLKENPLQDDLPLVVGNRTGYEGGENFEHDDTGAAMNASGCEDEMFSAAAEHDGWEEGYDY